MSISSPPAVGLPSIDSVIARNATKIELAFNVSGSGWVRVGRVQSMSQDTANNVQVLSELGSQFAVELKKGITTFSFTIAKFYVHTDVFDPLRSGAIFGIQLSDTSVVPTSVLEQFQSCSMNSVSRQYTSGQATVAQNASVVAIGQSYGAPD
jgi:hypothetical protein